MSGADPPHQMSNSLPTIHCIPAAHMFTQTKKGSARQVFLCRSVARHAGIWPASSAAQAEARPSFLTSATPRHAAQLGAGVLVCCSVIALQQSSWSQRTAVLQRWPIGACCAPQLKYRKPQRLLSEVRPILITVMPRTTVADQQTTADAERAHR